MGQYWNLLNLDREQNIGHLGKWLEWFPGISFSDLAHLQRVLRTPPDPSQGRLNRGKPPRYIHVWAWKSKEREPQPPNFTATIHDLPNELHTLIFSFIADYETALCLGITSRHFWAAGKARISSLFLEFCANPEGWAGCRLMFMGEYADSLPKKLTDAPCESDRLTIDEAHEIYSFPRTRIPLKGSLGRVIDDVVARIQQFQPWVHPFDGWCVRDTTNAGSRMWVLRNLDTKEYIRHTDIDHDNDSENWEFHDSEYREFYDVGHKFALRTSWGDIGHPVASGAWAGDRFDIVPEDDLEIVVGEDGQVTKVNGWEDVTDEVSKEIDSLVDLL